MTFRTLDDARDLAGKTALVRVDFNVPMEGGKVTDDTRLRVALPTIQRLRDAGAKVALLAHFDRPKGKVVSSMSLRPVVDDLEALIGAPVRFADDCVGDEVKVAIADLDAGGVILLENVRFHAGEEANDPAFAQQLADQIVQQVQLGRDLGPADDADDRLLRIAERGVERVQLAAHRLAGIGGQQLG